MLTQKHGPRDRGKGHGSRLRTRYVKVFSSYLKGFSNLAAESALIDSREFDWFMFYIPTFVISMAFNARSLQLKKVPASHDFFAALLGCVLPTLPWCQHVGPGNSKGILDGKRRAAFRAHISGDCFKASRRERTLTKPHKKRNEIIKTHATTILEYLKLEPWDFHRFPISVRWCF